jgi:two-component system, sensor histidine kinase YesM
MKFRHKLILSFTILTIFPMVVFGIYSYKIASDHSQEKTLSYGQSITKDVNVIFNGFVQDAATVTRHMIGDKELEELLRKEYSTYQYPIYEKTQDKKKYAYYLNHLMNLYSEMDYLLLIPTNQPYIVGHSSRSKPFFNENIKYQNTQWYKKTIKADGYWVYSGIHIDNQIVGSPNVISISRLIKDSETQRPLAVVKVMIDKRSLENILNQQEQKGEFSFLILDENKHPIGQSENFPLAQLNLDKLKNKLYFKGNDYLVSHSSSDTTGWTVYAVVNKELVLKELEHIKNGLFYLLILTFVISILFAYFLSANLVRPLERLKNSMTQVVNGKWKRLQSDGRKDEIGDLTKHYNSMIDRLDKFVHLLIEKEKQKKDLEYKSLQAQINPHFLYNTLNTVKWCAYLNKPDLVNDIVDSLSYILRFISKRNDDLITVKEEREFLEHYLGIMEIRFRDKYKIVWDFSNEINDCEVPILLLQPIVENAIIYGMEKEAGECIVWLRGFRKNNRLIFEIEDNGIGFIPNKTRPKGEKFSSIGLDNVKQRIELIYGQSGDINIVSIPSKGTKVSLHLPLVLPSLRTGVKV